MMKKPSPVFFAWLLICATLTLAACEALPSASGGSAARPAQAQSDAQADAQLMASGQWRDPETGLIWMRCAVGQTWTGGTCGGHPIYLDWEQARAWPAPFNQQGGFAGHTDWRLPGISELATLRRCSGVWRHEARETAGDVPSGQGRAEMKDIPAGQGTRRVPLMCANDSRKPTWDSAIFPGQFADWYWSSSPHAMYQGYAWLVNFERGSVVINRHNYPNRVRLLRTGP